MITVNEQYHFMSAEEGAKRSNSGFEDTEIAPGPVVVIDIDRGMGHYLCAPIGSGPMFHANENELCAYVSFEDRIEDIIDSADAVYQAEAQLHNDIAIACCEINLEGAIEAFANHKSYTELRNY